MNKPRFRIYSNGMILALNEEAFNVIRKQRGLPVSDLNKYYRDKEIQRLEREDA